MNQTILGTGELAALTAALLWAFSSMMWGRVHLSPLGINLAKNVVGTLLLTIHLVVLSVMMGQPVLTASWNSMGWLAISGFVGIVIGDTFFFRSLQIMGPRLALMLATAAPLFSALIGYYILREPLTSAALVGVVLTIAGISIVVLDRKARKEAPGLYPGSVVTGVLCGLAGAFCQSAGGALSKWGMEDCLPLEATVIRTMASMLLTVLFAGMQGRLLVIGRKLADPGTLKFVVPAASMGTWLGVWLSLVAFKYSPLATANTLMAVSPVFALPLVVFYYRQRATLLAVLGSLLAVAGVYQVATESTPLKDNAPTEAVEALPKS